MEFGEWVKTELSTFYERLKPIYMEWNEGRTDDCLSYYYAHKPRFDAMIDIIKRNAADKGHISELGSFLPYTSYHLTGTKVDCMDILFQSYNIDGFSKDRFNFKSGNLNKEFELGQPDLIIMSEVIEHLPSNLFKLEERVIKNLKKGAYLLVTYPMHGHNAQDYDKDFGEHDRFRHEHLREFTEATVPLFFKSLTFVDESYVTYPAYGRIKLVLYKNE